MKKESKLKQTFEYNGLKVKFEVLDDDEWMIEELGEAIIKAVHPLIYPAIKTLKIVTERKVFMPGKRKKVSDEYYGLTRWDLVFKRARIKLLGNEYKYFILETLAHEIAHILESIVGAKANYHSPQFLHFEAVVLERFSFEISACGHPTLEMGE